MKAIYCNIFPGFWHLCLAGSIALIISGCQNTREPGPAPPVGTNGLPLIPYITKSIYPHDTALFTEGLVFYKGLLYESGGAPAELPFVKSAIGVTDAATGNFTPKIEIDRAKYFGEGIVFLKNKLYQLTYRSRIGFVYDAATFKKTGTFNYASAEGWGMTTDGSSIIMSDGTEHLSFLDPGTYKPARIVKVTENGIPRDSLNELEYINGFIYANVWLRPEIVKIDTGSGKVVGKLDLTSIVNEVAARKPGSLEMNGIAYDSATGKVMITGKLWPSVYEIDFER